MGAGCGIVTGRTTAVSHRPRRLADGCAGRTWGGARGRWACMLPCRCGSGGPVCWRSGAQRDGMCAGVLLSAAPWPCAGKVLRWPVVAFYSTQPGTAGAQRRPLATGVEHACSGDPWGSCAGRCARIPFGGP